MEPDETKSIEQPQSPTLNQTNSKTPSTVHIAGILPLPQVSSGGESNSQPGLWAGLRLPMKRVGSIGVSLLILALIGSGLFNLAKGAIDRLIAKKSATTSQASEQSQPTTSETPTTASTNKNNCTDLPTRMTKAKITGREVDKVFDRTYPDLLKQRWRERLNKPLADTRIDRNLRQEWCAGANKLIEQK